MAGIESKIPGYTEAGEADNQRCLEGNLGMANSIMGVPVVPMTPRIFLELHVVESPFVVGGIPMPEDCAMFLWRVYEGYVPDFKCTTWWQRRKLNRQRKDFIKQVAKLPYAELVYAIRGYVEENFANKPSGKSMGVTDSAIITDWYSSVIHRFAKTYGWDEDTIANTSLRKLWQLMHRMNEDADEKYVQRSRAVMLLRKDYLNKRNKELQEEQARTGEGKV